ncbi:SURF1 family protein [Billgrantia gudaonensis]|uniref:SURF1-like protein n=1 Tax=Billgrantia gudaonensis TaxID=376427 RepID=A0A1G8SXE1_9GAMM|nr:SURF1 family protein [Halomonas gudaonensis]SDJ33853.1 Cytochrome oxidase assembly protein ShyY1 [Halomonas gudaonensis]
MRGSREGETTQNRRGGTRRWLWHGFWLLVIVLGLLLGLWQWERAADKRAYLERLDAAPHLESPASTPPDGARVTLHGEYLADHTLFLDNRTRDGELGVAVLTPLRDDSGRLWLVQRGFLATGPSRETPEAETPSGRVSVEGRWQSAGESAPVYGPNREGRRVQRIDLDAWPDREGFAYEGWLHLTGGDGAYPEWWQPSVMPPSRHLGYAVQWWGLALAALVVMIVGGRRRGRGHRRDPEAMERGSVKEEDNAWHSR